MSDELKPINEMTVAELVAFLNEPRIAVHAEPFNSKTRKSALIENAKQAHFKAGQLEAEKNMGRTIDVGPVTVESLPMTPARKALADILVAQTIENVNGPERTQPTRRQIMDQQAAKSRRIGMGGRALGAKHFRSRSNPDGPLIAPPRV